MGKRSHDFSIEFSVSQPLRLVKSPMTVCLSQKLCWANYRKPSVRLGSVGFAPGPMIQNPVWLRFALLRFGRFRFPWFISAYIQPPIKRFNLEVTIHRQGSSIIIIVQTQICSIQVPTQAFWGWSHSAFSFKRGLACWGNASTRWHRSEENGSLIRLLTDCGSFPDGSVSNRFLVGSIPRDSRIPVRVDL